MSHALKELLRLWWMQKRRSFSWKDVFLALYFGGLFVGVTLSLFFALRDDMAGRPWPFEPQTMVPLLSLSIVPGDLLIKLFWRRSPVEMDDYLRSRPVSARDWALLVLIDTLLSFMQWMLAMAIAFVVALLLPVGYALVALLLAFTYSLVNALIQNCWRHAPGNEFTLPLVFGYLVWLVLSYAVAILLFAVVGLAADDPSAPLRPGVADASTLVCSGVLLLLNVFVCGLLHRYFMRMKNHNEESHAPTAIPVRSLGEVSLWSIEWVQLLRSKRLRVSFLVIAVVFLLNTYMQQNPQMQQDMHLSVNPMLLLGIAFPSIILAQWVLGVEANFFSGVWTKPWPVEGILHRKFLFFCTVCALMALFILPCVLWLGMSLLAWVAALLFGCGCFVLPFMATCLYSSRMDLFASAFFNYQGGNRQLNVFSFVMFIPMGIYYAAYFLLPVMWAHAIIAGLGLLCLAFHRAYIRWIAGIWYRRRYEIMERWLRE